MLALRVLRRYPWSLVCVLVFETQCYHTPDCSFQNVACNPAYAALFIAGAFPSISIGFNSHTALNFVDGTVREWGGGSNGRLGNNASVNTADGTGPSIIATGDIQVGGRISQLSAGHQTTCGVYNGGNVRCWGFAGSGRLGNNQNATNTGDGVGPTIVAAGDVPLGVSAVQVAAGPHYTCVVTITGSVRCWGGSPAGETGYNSTASVGDGIGLSIVARGDVPLGGSAKQISIGANSTCAVLTTGAVRCWGSGASGELGYGSTSNVGDGIGPSIIAAGDVPLGGIATQVSVGNAHACALLTTGAVRCWGSGASGALGHNSTSNIGDGVGPSIIAAGDIPLGGSAVQISAGNATTCAVMAGTGTLRCWGSGALGALGRGNTQNIGDGTGPSIMTAGDVPVGFRVVQVATAAAATCAVLDSYANRVRCWGSGSSGALGYNSTVNVGDGLGLSIIARGDVPVGK